MGIIPYKYYYARRRGMATSEDTGTKDFTTRIIEEYTALYDEIEDGDRAEHDLMPRLVRRLFINALGFDESDYEQENDWNDVRIYDENRNPVIIIEGKRRDVDVEEGIDQTFRYASDSPFTEYMISTNVDELIVYERCSSSEADEERYGVNGRLITEVHFERVVETLAGSTLLDELSVDDQQSIARLSRLQKKEIYDPDRYDDFSIEDQQDVSTDTGFDNLLESLGTCLDEYFMPFTLEAFDEFQDRYAEYEREASDLQNQIEKLEEAGHENGSEIAELESQLAELKDDYEQYRNFHTDYRTWVRLSNRQENDEEDNKHVFCRESIYVQLNKILLIRIAEDKGLVNRMISNGGVEHYREFWDDFTRYVDRDYVDLFEVASEELSEIYDRLYSRQIFDWELSENGDLDEVIKKTFWHMNHYDFSDVNRDVLGHLYERHLPPEERKELGEFYTPTAVVDFILDRVGYTPDNALEQRENDLLDPACGSGTFLVRAAGRLLERLDRLNVTPREAIETVKNRLWGFDLNPFACHITEMNLLFQVIDLYKEVKDEDPEYSLERFHIYQTDSLRRQTQTNMSTLQSDALLRKYEKERREADQAKNRDDYGFVVGNPPYVRIQNIPDGQAKEDYGDFTAAHHNYDLYMLFIEKASEWLNEDDEGDREKNGKLGFIVSNKFIDARYGEKLKELVPQRYRLGELVNIGDTDVFEHATTYPLIMIAEKANVDRADRSAEEFVIDDYRFSYVSVNESMEDWLESDAITGWDTGSEDERGEELNHRVTDLLELALPGDWGGETPDFEQLVADAEIPISDNLDIANEPPLQSYPVASGAIATTDWQFAPADEQDVLAEIEDAGTPLEEYCYDGKVERGLRTGKNPVFIVDQETIDEYGIEEDLVHPLVGGKDVKRWEHLWEDKYIIYTPPGLDIESYPNTIEYYNDGDNREELEDRYCVREGQNDWWELDKPKDPKLFERPKIVTPDIAYYNNFWMDDSGDFYCLDTTYYVVPENEDHAWYLAGILNSDLVQFYFRRNTATYRGNYLRYKSEYLQRIPIPDPDEADAGLVDEIADRAKEMQSLLSEYREAEHIVENPGCLLDNDEVERVSLPLSKYVERVPDVDDDDPATVSANVSGETIRLNLANSIEFSTENAAERFAEYIEVLGISTVSELLSTEVPRTPERLEALLERYRSAMSLVDDAGSQLREKEDGLHDAVYRLYGLSDESRSLLEERVDTPTNPLDSKIR